MEEISISVVIPNYNHAAYLAKAINCIMRQTIPANEIIVIDDGSTDESLPIIRTLQLQYPQIKLLQNDRNRGVIFTINRGLYEATGSHLLMAAADDWIEPTLIENAKQQLGRYPNVGLWSSSSWIAYENDPDKQLTARMLYPCQRNRDYCYLPPLQAQQMLLRLDSWFMGNTLILNRKHAIAEGAFLHELQSLTDNFLYKVLAAKYGCCFSTQKLGTWQIRKTSFANSFNIQPEKQIAVIEHLIQLMQKKYSELFSAKLISRTKQRLSFNLARTMWLQQQGQMNNDLQKIIKNSIACKKMQNFCIPTLKLVSRVPKIGMYLGQVILFLSMRPFDLPNQVRLLRL